MCFLLPLVYDARTRAKKELSGARPREYVQKSLTTHTRGLTKHTSCGRQGGGGQSKTRPMQSLQTALDVVAAGKASSLQSAACMARPRPPSREAAQSRVMVVDARCVRRRGRGRPVRLRQGASWARRARKRRGADPPRLAELPVLARRAERSGACPSVAYETSSG